MSRIKRNLQFLFYPVFSTRAILIRTTRLTETSLIVHWMSEGEGMIKTVAKGALRPKSVFSGKLDLFFSGEILVARSRKSELHTLREVSIFHWRQGLRRSYLTTLMAGYFCQLIEAGVEMDHPDPAVYDLLRRALDHLDQEEASLRALRSFEKQFAAVLGVSRDRMPGELALREHLGGLPASRRRLVEDLEGR
ncbi:MAG: repair protein RecO [Verrucomicrobiota bacterium]